MSDTASISFGDRFDASCRARYPICLGLDPRLDEIPAFVCNRALAEAAGREDAVRRAIAGFHEILIEAVAELIPAVKLQLAFYEQYGIAGLLAYQDTVRAAQRSGMLVIADGKRNDIGSTATAYARAFLGSATAFGEPVTAFQADALTVNPYLGWDSLTPFAEVAQRHGKGIFVLVHTSNPSSVEIQELAPDGEPMYLRAARLTARLQDEFFPSGEMASVGAIAGCTFPDAADEIRHVLPRAPIVVVGFGAQAGSVDGCAACFTDDRRGALVNASRSLTYSAAAPPQSANELAQQLLQNVEMMAGALEVAPTAPHA